MLFSSSTEYAIRGLMALVKRAKDNRPVLLETIISDTGLPPHYLPKVFWKLVKGGILFSTKGRGGGFSCARAPGQISLMQIIEVMEGRRGFDHCASGVDKCDPCVPCAQHERYSLIRNDFNKYLNTTTLADVTHSPGDFRAEVNLSQM